MPVTHSRLHDAAQVRNGPNNERPGPQHLLSEKDRLSAGVVLLRSPCLVPYNPGMAAFDDVLASIRGWDQEEPPPADVFDQLATEYRAVTDQRDGATVQISERDSRISELAAEVSRLKSENYDLAIRVGFKEPEDNSGANNDDDNQSRGVLGLFRKVNKA